jgi:hypothetical protein
VDLIISLAVRHILVNQPFQRHFVIALPIGFGGIITLSHHSLHGCHDDVLIDILRITTLRLTLEQ